MINFLDILLVFVILMTGTFLAKSLARVITWPEAISVGFPLGLGCLTYTIFLFSWAGLPFKLWSVWLIQVSWLLVSVFLARTNIRTIKIPKRNGISLRLLVNNPDIWGWFLFVLIAVVYCFISFGMAYGGWDSISIWASKGYGIAKEGSILAAATYGEHGLYYPLNIPIGIGLFSLAGPDLLPFSKMIFSLYFLSILITIKLYLRRLNVSSMLSWVIVFFIATTPYLLEYSLRAYANVPFAFYIVSGILLITLGLMHASVGTTALGSLLLAFASWTRVEGIQFGILLFGTIILFGGKNARRIKQIGIIFLPLVAIFVPWMIFRQLHPTQNLIADLQRVAFQQVIVGNIHISAIFYTIKFILWRTVKSDQVWGIFIPLTSAYTALAILFRKDIKTNLMYLLPLASAAIYGFGVVLMYFITSYDQSFTLEYWLGTGVDRMLIPAIFMMGAIGGAIVALDLTKQWTSLNVWRKTIKKRE